LWEVWPDSGTPYGLATADAAPHGATCDSGNCPDDVDLGGTPPAAWANADWAPAPPLSRGIAVRDQNS